MTLIRKGIRRQPETRLGQLFASTPKTCKVCKCQFDARLPMATVCSMECAKSLAVSIRGKAEKQKLVKERKDTKEKLARLKTRAQWAKEAQQAFNGWVRARDAGMPCISCGRHHQGQNHAGHYLSVGSRPELRYEPLNVHLQCAPCNTHLSGNAVLYRQALLAKIGPDYLAWLEGPHPTRHYTVEKLQEIKRHYSAKTKALKKEQV
jgi:hypothetical protein